MTETQLAGTRDALALAVVLGALSLPCTAQAQQKPAGLEGSWSGSGFVSFASGAKELARCRAHYKRRTNTSYALIATCHRLSPGLADCEPAQACRKPILGQLLQRRVRRLRHDPGRRAGRQPERAVDQRQRVGGVPA